MILRKRQLDAATKQSEVTILLFTGSSERNNGKAVDEGAAAVVLQDEFAADEAQKPTAAGKLFQLLLLRLKLLNLVSYFSDHPTNDSNSAAEPEGEILNNAQKQNAETATTTNQFNNEGTHWECCQKTSPLC